MGFILLEHDPVFDSVNKQSKNSQTCREWREGGTAFFDFADGEKD